MIEKLKRLLSYTTAKYYYEPVTVYTDDLREIIRQLEQAEKMREALVQIGERTPCHCLGCTTMGKTARIALNQAKGNV